MALQTFDIGSLLASQKPDYSGLANAVQSYYAGKTAATASHYQPQMLQSEIGKRLADTDLAKANTRYTGLQSDYYPQLTKAQIAQYLADAARKNQQAELDRAIFGPLFQQGGNPGGGLPAQQGSDPLLQAVEGQIQQQQQQGSQMPGQMPRQNQAQGQMARPQSAGGINVDALRKEAIRHHVGAPPPFHQVTDDGNLVIHDPLTGETNVIPIGASYEEKAFKTEDAKNRAKLLDETYQKYAAYEKQAPSLNELTRIVNSPEYARGAGVFSSRLQPLLGSEDVKATLAEANALGGQLVNDSIGIFGNRITNSEYNALKKIKFSNSEMPAAGKAKVNMMNLVQEQGRQFYQNLYENLKTMDRVEATEKARASIDVSEIKNAIKSDNLAHQISNSTKKSYEDIMDTAELIAQQQGRNVVDVLSDFASRKK